MMSKARIIKAKCADLPSVLQNRGIKLYRQGRSFCLAGHDSLKLFRYQGMWLYKWWSRNGEVGDGIQFLQRYCGVGFQDAVAELSGSVLCTSRDGAQYQKQQMPESWSSIRWLKKAERLVDAAAANLFDPRAVQSLEYLTGHRGLLRQTIRERRIGWLPARAYMPSKIVIPCYNSKGRLMRVRFRMDQPKPNQCRYRIMKGSNPSSSFPLGLSPDKPVLWLESELDGMLIHQEAGNFIGVLALGSAANRLGPDVMQYLRKKIALNLICLDNDNCGKRRTWQILQQLPNAVKWTVPEAFGKDPGEAWMHIDIADWVRKGIKSGIGRISKR